MFSKILIANRGEIACRVIRTARRMVGLLALTIAILVPAAAGACTVGWAEPTEAKARAGSTVVVSGRYDVRAGGDAKHEFWWAGTITAAKVTKGLRRSAYSVSNRAEMQEGCPRGWLPNPAHHPQPYSGTFFLEASGRGTYLIIKFVPNRKR